MSGRYKLTKAGILPGEHLLWCTECGALICDSGGVTAHDRFHAALSARQLVPVDESEDHW
jgi:hypothetical protein